MNNYVFIEEMENIIYREIFGLDLFWFFLFLLLEDEFIG